MTTKTTTSRQPQAPKPRTYGPPDPGLFAGLAVEQLDLVRQLIVSGWYMHEAVQGPEDAWWETAELLDDLGLAWNTAFAAGSQAVA